MSIEKLTAIFADVLGDKSLILRPDLQLKDIPKWDSFNLISLMLALEKAFKIKFSASEVNSIVKISDLTTILASKCDYAFDFN